MEAPFIALCLIAAETQALSQPGTISKLGHAFKWKHRLDIPGLLTFAAAMTSFLLLVDSLTKGISVKAPITLTPLIVFPFSIILLILIETRWSSHPLLAPSLFKNKGVSLQYLVQILLLAAQFAVLSNIPNYFIRTLNVSSTLASLTILPAPLGNALGSYIAGLWIQRSKTFLPPLYLTCILSPLAFAIMLVRWSPLPVPQDEHGKGGGLTAHIPISLWECLVLLPAAFSLGLTSSAGFVGISTSVDDGLTAMGISVFYLSQQVGTIVGAAGGTGVARMAFEKILRGRLVNQEMAEFKSVQRHFRGVSKLIHNRLAHKQDEDPLESFLNGKHKENFIDFLGLYGDDGVILRELVMLVSTRYLLSSEPTHMHPWGFKDRPLNKNVFRDHSFLRAFALCVQSGQLEELKNALLQQSSIDVVAAPSDGSGTEYWQVDCQVWKARSRDLQNLDLTPLHKDLIGLLTVLPEEDSYCISERRAQCYSFHWERMRGHIDLEHFSPSRRKIFPMLLFNLTLDMFLEGIERRTNESNKKLYDAIVKDAPSLNHKKFLHTFIKHKWAILVGSYVLRDQKQAQHENSTTIEEVMKMKSLLLGKGTSNCAWAAGTVGFMLADLITYVKDAKDTAVLNSLVEVSSQWCEMVSWSAVPLARAALSRLLPLLERSDILLAMPTKYNLDCGFTCSRAGHLLLAEHFFQRSLPYGHTVEDHLRPWRFRVEYITVMMRQGMWKEAESRLKSLEGFYQHAQSPAVVHDISIPLWRCTGELGEFRLWTAHLRAEMLLLNDLCDEAARLLKQCLLEVQGMQNHLVTTSRIAVRSRLIQFKTRISDTNLDFMTRVQQQLDDILTTLNSERNASSFVWALREVIATAEELASGGDRAIALKAFAYMFETVFRVKRPCLADLERHVRKRKGFLEDSLLTTGLPLASTAQRRSIEEIRMVENTHDELPGKMLEEMSILAGEDRVKAPGERANSAWGFEKAESSQSHATEEAAEI
ncbi:uncharacterized protein KY384_001186 [Bacidia gigantensis]|uniref:uncharacterized protein n=1 Tax=Bacidia gigantensis TaxID=2732470 RepID=UPI001D040798|nr:uncharacterized protein KY384_001186 [Bacidia gigantensis]KAG8534342.1 hypothetical protein KY384_001186 [Bacidia gigantensis]